MLHSIHGGIRCKSRRRLGTPAIKQITPNVGALLSFPLPKDSMLSVAVGDEVKVGSFIFEAPGECPVLSPVHAVVESIDDKVVLKVLEGEAFEEDLPPLEEKLVSIDQEVLWNRLHDCAVLSPSVGRSLVSLCRESVERSKEKRIRLVVDCSAPTKKDFAFLSLIKYNRKDFYSGIKILMRATNASEAIIIAGNSSLSTVRRLERLVDDRFIKLRLCESKYPMHEKRLLTYLAVTRELRPDASPLFHGCAVVDAETCVRAYEATVLGKRQTERLVSVTSFLGVYCASLPLGLPLSQSGPFKGCAVTSENYPMDNDLEEERFADASVRCVYAVKKAYSYTADCIGCLKCDDTCPMYLPVSRLVAAGKEKRVLLAKDLRFDVCIGCGACSASCPSGIEIREIIKEALK